MTRENSVKRRRRSLLCFGAATDGATAVEFALVSLPFLGLLTGIFQLGMVFMLSTTLDNALSQATRQIRTGQYQTAGTVTGATFEKDVCSGLGWLQATCPSNLDTDVQTFTTFKQASTNMISPLSGKVYDPSKLTNYKTTAPCDIVVVRAYYKWPLAVPFLDKATMPISDGSMLITSTVAFRNEPFTASVTSC
jgi:Flp pilus assembly protein TadG